MKTVNSLTIFFNCHVQPLT